MTTNSPNPVDGDAQALIERLNRLAEKLKWHNVGYAQDILKAVDLLTTPPAQLLRPVELPNLLQPGADGYDDWYMHSSEDGEYMKADDVIAALENAGVPYEVKS